MTWRALAYFAVYMLGGAVAPAITALAGGNDNGIVCAAFLTYAFGFMALIVVCARD